MNDSPAAAPRSVRRRPSLWRGLTVFFVSTLAACAIVDSITETLRFAGGIFSGKGEVDGDGKQEGDWEYLSEGGVILARGRYEDDRQVGLWTYYFENGQKEYEGHIENERRVGRYQFWHPNSNPRAAGYFVAGREFGDWTFWSSNGRVGQVGAFSNGLQQGQWTSFHADGGLASVGRYWDGDPVGRWEIVGPGQTRADARLSWTPMPDGLEWVSERWDSGMVRREGFLLSGQKAGLWRLNHQDGSPRLVGEFKDGTPHGTWFAYARGAELVAEGEVDFGRPVGEWRFASTGGGRVLDAAGFPPPTPFTGSWSEESVLTERGTDGALAVWLSEVRSPLADGAVVDDTEPDAEQEVATEAELAEATIEPDVPVKAQPFTRLQQKIFDRLKTLYTERPNSTSSASIYGGAVSNRGGAKDDDTLGGDEDSAAAYVGNPLPLTVFKDGYGAAFDLESLKGQRVVLVILRGYPGGVCIYCTAQTAALYEANAPLEFAKLGARLEIVFPGQKNGLEAFKEAVQSLSDVDFPEYGMLYENDYIVGPMLKIEGSKVIPTTFILDEEGIVRFAYVAKTPQDRPSVELLTEELKKLN